MQASFLQVYGDHIGLLGVTIILVYYFLLQIGKCKANQLGFSVANFTGSICILLSLVYSWNLAAVIIEIAWAIISFFGICKILYRRFSHI